ncbi:hypothetical protein WJ542_07280 [Paraburkholderia sp. B3]|uniref:hypothetical protein n=1 Tax=Paraburkholderia sp. B3 TaxID=3134791 RepID=UPI003981D555
MSGDLIGARADYIRFARWMPENSINAAYQIKLSILGIDAAAKRQHPFGNANPMRDAAERELATAQASLQAAATPSEQAHAHGEISAYLDGTAQHAPALLAIDKAIALAPDDISLKQSRVTTLVSLDREDDALAAAAPLLDQMHHELASAAEPAAVYQRYIEVTSSSAWTRMLKGDWSGTVDMLDRCARGSDAISQDYLAALYVIVRARSNGEVPADPYFEEYILHRSSVPTTQYHQMLLQYVRGRVPLASVYEMVAMISDPAALQNALSETWMIAAAYERFVKHDDAIAQTYRERIKDLEPYGATEWMMVKYGGV